VEVDVKGRIVMVESARPVIRILTKLYPMFYGVNEVMTGGGGRL